MTKKKKNILVNFPVIIIPNKWESYYHFGIAKKRTRFEIEYDINTHFDAYDEYFTISFKGILYKDEPELKVLKNTDVEIDISINYDSEKVKYAKSIGFIEYKDKKILRIYLSIPNNNMINILSLAKSNKIKGMTFTTTNLRYLTGSVKDFSIHTDFNPEEY